MNPGITVAAVENARALFDSGWNLYFERRFGRDGLLATALRAGILDHDSGAVADGTSARDAEEALLVAHLSAAVALFAGDGGFAGRCTSAMTLSAGFAMTYGYFLRYAEDGFFERESQIFTNIVSALCARATTARTKDIAKAKEVSEDVGEILEIRWIESAEASGATDAGVAELVIARAFVGVAEHGVGFAALLEALLCVRIVRIAIRMVLHRELAIRTLDLDFGRGATYAEYLVVIPFCIRGQGYFSSKLLSFSAAQLHSNAKAKL